MAKKSEKPIETEVIEEVMVDEAVAEVEIEEKAVEVAEDTSNQFIYTQLKAINKLNDPAKAKRLAERVLRNKK